MHGEQVTADVILPGPTQGGGDLQPRKTTLRLVFGEGKTLLALVNKTAGETNLTVFERPADPNVMRRMLNSRVYRLGATGRFFGALSV